MDREDRGAGPLVEKLSETIKYRMPGFEAIDIIDILPAMLQLCPNDDELFGMLSDRMKEKIEDFNALNLVGVVRAYLKRGDVQIVKDLLLPRLIESLQSYDPIEVAEMLIAIGQATSTDVSLSGDMHILQCLIPELESKFTHLPFLVQLNVVWALAKMNVNHSLFRSGVIERFTDPQFVADLPTKVLAKSSWIFARIGAFKTNPELLNVFMPIITSNRGIFNSNEFARLVMAFADHPAIREDLVATAHRLVEALNCEEEESREPGTSTRKSRQDILMILSGLHRLGMIKGPNDPILASIEKFIQKEEAKFEPSEIQQLVGIFYKTDYTVLVDTMFPKTWKELIDSSKKRIDQILQY